MVKGAALLLPAEEALEAEPPPAAPPDQAPGRQEQHLRLMMQLLRPQDAVRLVRAGHPRGGDGVGWDEDGDRMGMAWDWDGPEWE